MSSQYEPQKHIIRLDSAPRSEGVLEQREITIQSYQTTIPFDLEAINRAIDASWLTPQIRFGVFARGPLQEPDAISVVLGLQDELSVRAYDYDKRRPIWFSWQNLIVDTVSVRYSRDEDGLLRFKTTGGGRRISDDRLHEFNAAFLNIPKEAVKKRNFDLVKLRELCFGRFSDRLYMLRFSDPSGEEYRSIDHALFQSRRYIDPLAERLQEIRADGGVSIESFDSDIEIRLPELASPIQVRFFIRGLSGSLRLRFPKVDYKNDPKTTEDQVRAFYKLVDVVENSILDADYYTHLPRSLDELEVDCGLFIDNVDLTMFREVLTSESTRAEFFDLVEPAEHWWRWQPHLRALDELLAIDMICQHVVNLAARLLDSDPLRASRILDSCRSDACLSRVGAVVASAVAAKRHSIAAEHRARVEESLLAWAIEHEKDCWDVDQQTGEITTLNTLWFIDDLSLEIIPSVLWKLVGVIHDRLKQSSGEIGPLLEKFAWCISQSTMLPPNDSRSPSSLRLIAAQRVPKTVRDGDKVLRQPVSDLVALDNEVLAQFGLPMWPHLVAHRKNNQLLVSNTGIGAAIGLVTRSAIESSNNKRPGMANLLSGESAVVSIEGNVSAIIAEFEKYGERYQVTLEVGGDMQGSSRQGVSTVLNTTAAICRKRRIAQREYRQTIDPQGIVVGSSIALMQVFEQIHHANLTVGNQAVLILGERGVGKTHIAQLLHCSSKRASKPFKVVNAGGGGGDVNIQRGEWIGYGKGHGIQGIGSEGRPGHIMEAMGGSMFIDEFASLSQDLQVIFLSVLEGHPINKIGGEEFKPDVRCIFATNADIDEAMESGALRRDLVDRIGTTIYIPALRDRRGDILTLTKHFALENAITDRCLAALLRHDWPGNVRELQKVIGRAIASKTMTQATRIDLEHVDLPIGIVSVAKDLDVDDCRREIWLLADEIAREEGLSPGAGLQKRAGELMGVGEAQASKMYRTLGIADSSIT